MYYFGHSVLSDTLAILHRLYESVDYCSRL